MQSFLILIKLIAHFKDQHYWKLKMEDQIFKPQSDMKWTPNKNHNSIETYIEATEKELRQQGDISDNK